jgi:Na+/melibiose symporter-like transporter
MLSNPGALSQDTFLPNTIELNFPFLLPNVVAAILCILAMLGVALFVTEEEATDPIHANTSARITAGEMHPLLPSNVNKGKRSTRVIASVDAFNEIWKNKSTRMHMLSYWAFSFVVVCIEEALPLFLIARYSGPGLSPNQIGWILTTAGLMVVLCQTGDGTWTHLLTDALVSDFSNC